MSTDDTTKLTSTTRSEENANSAPGRMACLHPIWPIAFVLTTRNTR